MAKAPVKKVYCSFHAIAGGSLRLNGDYQFDCGAYDPQELGLDSNEWGRRKAVSDMGLLNELVTDGWTLVDTYSPVRNEGLFVGGTRFLVTKSFVQAPQPEAEPQVASEWAQHVVRKYYLVLGSENRTYEADVAEVLRLLEKGHKLEEVYQAIDKGREMLPETATLAEFLTAGMTDANSGE
ncbi:MAG: hypothetical protein HN348_13200 [Proteobacteria bacterium]|nr:hypothetical protein [Pseudomonadota bacterium]